MKRQHDFVIRPLAIFTLLLPSLITFAQEPTDDLYMDAFVVVADTSQDYQALRTRMFSIAHQLGLQIDSMGRGYDAARNLIALPIDDADELYAGEYFPRRYPSETLSLEYLSVYTSGGYMPFEKTIALVAAIATDRETAERILAQVSAIARGAYIVESRIYMGCMH